jgi:hypothetical protein
MADSLQSPAWTEQEDLRKINGILATLATRPASMGCQWLHERLYAARTYLVNRMWAEYRAQLEFVLSAPASECNPEMDTRAREVAEELLSVAKGR